MMTLIARLAAIVLLACATIACTSVGDIQRQKPVRTTSFSADPQLVARCVQGRLGGKLQSDADGRLVVYDAVKSRQSEGITHYSVTVGKGEKRSFAELRLVRPVRGHGMNLPPPPRASAELIAEYWDPVVQCAKATP